MAEGSTSSSGPFDVPTVKALIQLMNRHDVSEIDLRQGDQRIRLLRGGPQLVSVSPPAEFANPPAAAAPAPAPSPAPAPKKEALAKALHEIKSPTPGVFYAKPNPDAEHYVKKGSKIAPDTVVCLIEAMKLFTEINAEVSGVIEEILVQDGQSVEYGTVLFRVDTGA